jgi:hypothetical protein
MYKKFSCFFLFFFLLLLVIPLCINVCFDPYNFFNSRLTDFITVSEERKIKLSYLRNHRDVYDSVVIGSSRSSYIDSSSFLAFKMFNLSVSGISIEEYLPYLKFFEQTQGRPKLIILSLDFHNTNLNYRSNVDPNTVIHDVGSVLMKSLDYIKLKTLYSSFLLMTKNPETIGDYYTRKLVKKRSDQSLPLSINTIKNTIHYYKTECLKNYKYRVDFHSHLLMIKNAFPTSKIIVIVCPIHQSLIDLQKDIAGDLCYKRWLLEIKSVFGEITDFTVNNEITTNPYNFFDAAHFYPFVGSQIIEDLQKHAV